MDWYTEAHGCAQGLRQRWPAHGHNCVRDRISHQRNGLAEQKDLRVVTGLRQRVRMQERESRLGWIVGAPSALHKYLHAHLVVTVLALPNAGYELRAKAPPADGLLGGWPVNDTSVLVHL